MHRGRASFAIGSALGCAFAFASACASFDETDATPAGDGGDGATTDDVASGDATSDSPKSDAPAPGQCEVLTGTQIVTASAPVIALAADGTHVYWSEQGGVFRATVGGMSPVAVANEGATHIVLGGTLVAWRTPATNIRFKPKADVTGDAGVPNSAAGSRGISPRAADSFFSRRNDGIFSCTTTICGEIVNHDAPTDVVGVPSGFDFMASNGNVVGVYHCTSGCAAADAGELLATASMLSSEVAGDSDFVYWVDVAKGAVRKVVRQAGATPIDVITGLVEPRDVAIDDSGRIIVTTFGNGIFRGPKTGCVAPAVPATSIVAASHVAGNTVWYSEGTAIKRVSP